MTSDNEHATQDPSPDDAYAGPLRGVANRPLLLVAISLIAGIVWADWAGPEPLTVALLAAVAIGLVILEIVMKVPRPGVFLCLAAALVGASLHAYRIRPSSRDPMYLAECGPVTLAGSVSRIIRQSEFCQRVEIDVHGADAEGVSIGAAGKLLCTLPPEPTVGTGQTLLLKDVVVWSPAAITSPGQYDEKRALARRGIHAIGRAADFAVTARQPLWRVALDTGIARIRTHVVSVLRAAMPGTNKQLYADLLAGMVFGMYNVQLPEEIVESFRRSGTIHLMVVSGAHVTLLATVIIFLVQGLRVRLPLWIILIVAPPLLLYALVAGLRASVMRSLAMAILLVASMVTGRRYDFWTALAIAATVLCIADTSAPFSIGVQLTFAAVIGVVGFMPRARQSESRRQSKAYSYLVSGAGATLGAWLLTAPIIAYHFNMLILVGILANLIAIPLRVVILYAGFIAVLVGSVWPPLAILPCAIGRIFGALTLWVVQGFAAMPGAALGVFHMPPVAIAAWYVAAGVIWWLLFCSPLPQRGESGRENEQQPRRWQWAVVAIFALGGLVFLAAALWARPPQHLRVTVLAVGQGNCNIISDTAGHHVMFDAGTGLSSPRAYHQVGRRVILPYLAHRGIRHLDALIMSHSDTDHCSGMADIMNGLAVRRFVTNGLTTADQHAATRALNTSCRLRIPGVAVRAGAKMKLAGGADLSVLHPSRVALGNRSEDINNNSVAVRLSYGDISILFPADLEAEGERTLVRWARANGVPLQSTVLVLSHHGRKASSTPEFLDAVSPQLAIVSGASKRYMPAHAEVARRLKMRGIPLISTDIMGTVDIFTDGRRLWISTFGGRYSRERDTLRWQARTATRNSSALAHAPLLTPRCEEIEPARRLAS